MILERGYLLNNRYRIVEILGQGGMGSVYRAVDENLGVEVAVKDNLFTTEEYARQFRREAVILANLRHPNLPRVTDHFVIEGQGQYLVMDYIEGEDLRQRMDRVGTIPEDEVVAIGAAMCDALQYLATRNPPIVHRDIKPGNVKITPQGQIFLVDFGLAKVSMGSQITTTGARAMTPGYSPPEQYGTARTDQRSDIFSLGATLYASLTECIPEDGLARAMDQADLTPIRKHNARVSRRLASVIEKALSVRPDDRYATPEHFKQALLASKGMARQRAGEYQVEPPPQAGDIPLPPPGMMAEAEEASRTPPPGVRTPAGVHVPSMVSEPIIDPWEIPEPVASGTGGWRRGCFVMLLIAVILLLGGGAVAIYMNPGLPEQAAAWTRGAGQVPAVVVLDDTSTPTEVGITATYTEALPIVAQTETPAPSLTPTAGFTPTPTEEPTSTPTKLPTPYGGGAAEIAFVSERSGDPQVYIIGVDGENIRQVTNLVEGACQPDWSPDGEWIVFISPCDSNHESYPGAALFLVDANGENLTPLATVPGGDYDPVWSPDGTKIAFTSLRDGGRAHIYVYSVEDNSVERLSTNNNRDFQPAWSPDGSTLAFVSTRGGPPQIWLMDSDGENQRLLTRSGGRMNYFPAWSPNGELVLFTQVATAESFPHLRVINLGEEELREHTLHEGPFPMREGSYTSDGVWIVFEGWPLGQNHDIYIMASNGAGRQQITTEPSREYDAAWRPTNSE